MGILPISGLVCGCLVLRFVGVLGVGGLGVGVVWIFRFCVLRYVLLVGWRFSGLGGLDGVFGLPVSFDLVWVGIIQLRGGFWGGFRVIVVVLTVSGVSAMIGFNCVCWGWLVDLL